MCYFYGCVRSHNLEDSLRHPLTSMNFWKIVGVHIAVLFHEWIYPLNCRRLRNQWSCNIHCMMWLFHHVNFPSIELPNQLSQGWDTGSTNTWFVACLHSPHMYTHNIGTLLVTAASVHLLPPETVMRCSINIRVYPLRCTFFASNRHQFLPIMFIRSPQWPVTVLWSPSAIAKTTLHFRRISRTSTEIRAQSFSRHTLNVQQYLPAEGLSREY